MNPMHTPVGTRAEFETIVRDEISKFTSNALCARLEAGAFTVSDYHSLLITLFHQVFNGPATFSMAAAYCDRAPVRDYLMHHADEEKTHWQWILNDLRATGYTGPPIDRIFPSPATAAYVSFNFYIAQRSPIARLAIAVILESLGATFGKKYATGICKALGLRPDQATFFFGHGDTDIGHTAEIISVIDQCDLTPSEWGWMCFAAKTAGGIYYRMYDDLARSPSNSRSAA